MTIFESALLTEAINRLNKTFPSNSNLGIVVPFIGASLDFETTKCTLETPDFDFTGGESDFYKALDLFKKLKLRFLDGHFHLRK